MTQHIAPPAASSARAVSPVVRRVAVAARVRIARADTWAGVQDESANVGSGTADDIGR